MKKFEGQNFKDRVSTSPNNIQYQDESSIPSQATTLNPSQSMSEPSVPVDMCTQFAIAVADTKPKHRAPPLQSNAPNVMHTPMALDAIFDFTEYNQEPFDSFDQAGQMQMDPMPPYFQPPLPCL